MNEERRHQQRCQRKQQLRQKFHRHVVDGIFVVAVVFAVDVFFLRSSSGCGAEACKVTSVGRLGSPCSHSFHPRSNQSVQSTVFITLFVFIRAIFFFSLSSQSNMFSRMFFYLYFFRGCRSSTKHRTFETTSTSLGLVDAEWFGSKYAPVTRAAALHRKRRGRGSITEWLKS